MAAAAVPAIPGWLEASGDEDLSLFLDIWRRVLAWDAAAGVAPGTAGTVLVARHDAIRMLTPCDVGDPFMQDEQLQRTLLRRHLLEEAVQPPAAGAAAATVRNLAGQPVQVLPGPTFTAEGAPPMLGKPLGEAEPGLRVYLVDAINCTCSEVTDAIGRHPQPNPFWHPGMGPPVPEPQVP